MPIHTSAGSRIVLKPADHLPLSPEVAMPTKSELLIITSTEHMCDAELAGLTGKARLVMWLQEGAPTELKSSEIEDGLCRCSESREAYWGHALRSHVEPLKAIEGMALGVSLDPLESAIMSTAGLLADATGQAAQRLDKHLAQLLDIQLNRVAAHE
ncbi:hypothetical protein [Pseudomonas monteilii]|uniref:hypothetical protein n=2 Tax=Pseudomonas monteilii TaxID=76759 RepID=UPI0013DF23C1|nr:hypothetical protein [Pseudomonas monteilii]QIG20515.1 hypothetical protein FY041_23520 [Pseudomonas monteilii]QIG25765.1 hypothetical protein FY043_23515 [Pseudomonas monteilii]